MLVNNVWVSDFKQKIADYINVKSRQLLGDTEGNSDRTPSNPTDIRTRYLPDTNL
jgi:hypothetical protein